MARQHHPQANPLFCRRLTRFQILLLRGKRPVGLAKTKPSNKASAQGTSAKGTGRESGKAASSASSVVPPRKTLPELLREEKVSREIEKGLAERREPPLEDGRERRSQSPGPTAGSSVRETPGKETEEVEPGMVIDWLLEKREKK